MSTEEFITRLRIAAPEFDWGLCPDTRRGSERRRSPRFRLVASLKGEPTARFDPIAAVCFASTGRIFDVAAWPEAARMLGLTTPDGGRLLAASQDRTWEDSGDGTRQPVADLITLRRELLQAVGLIGERSARA